MKKNPIYKFFTVLLVAGVMMIPTTASAGIGYNMSHQTSDLNITSGEYPYVISGISTQYGIIVNAPGQTVNIALEGVSIKIDQTNKDDAFRIVAGTVNLTLVGENTLQGGEGFAGLQNGENTLNISGNGSLHAVGGGNGAGIGGGHNSKGGNITINGGTIVAEGGAFGAGIGGGNCGSGESIKINGGKVTASGGNNAAGIGGGYYGDGENIEIYGETVVANGGNTAAGIGGGWHGNGENILIKGGTVTAKGGSDGAGIGASYGGPVFASGIIIDGGSVKATAGAGANMIGTKYTAVTPKNSSGTEVFLTTKPSLSDTEKGYLTGNSYNMTAANTIDWKYYLYLPKYAIIYNNVEGAIIINRSEYNILDSVTLCDAIKSGQEFKGWFDAASGGNKVTVIEKGSTGDKVLYAAWSPISVLSSDASLKAEAMVKGQQVTSIGIPNSTLGLETAGTVTITAAKAADTSGTDSLATLFDKNDTNAIVKVVKYVSGGSTINFSTDTAYENEAIKDEDFFIVRVTAQDATTVNYYRIDVKVTPAPPEPPAPPSNITAASISGIVQPEAGIAPITAASLTEGGGTYTITGLTWKDSDGTTPATLTPEGKFKAGWTYKAVIELTSASGNKFQVPELTPTVNSGTAGAGSVIGGDIEGNKLTFVVEFDKTAAQSVSTIVVKTQPATLTYTEGDAINLSGLVVTLTYNDGTMAEVPFANFTDRSITVTPDNGASLTTVHNGQPIILTCNTHKAATSNLTVNALATPHSGGSSTQTTKSKAAEVEILVKDKLETAGAATTTTNPSGQKVTTFAVDPLKVEQQLAAEGNGSTVTILVNQSSDVVIGSFTGQTVKNMENKKAVLEIKTEKATYTLPVEQLNMDAVLAQLGQQVNLSDIKINITIAKPLAETIKLMQDTADKNNYQIIVNPVEFNIICSSNGKTVEISEFNSYVERIVAIPDGVDPAKITTGIVVNADGTVRHVPSQVVQISGKYYVKINSLTNSTYAAVWNPVTFDDVVNHWAKEAINDMGSRMVVTGVGNVFNPNSDITRAEFAAIVVRALGLEAGTGENKFSDIEASDWYCGYVETANKYGIINGCDETTFAPNAKITREQAMAMIVRAMKITSLEATLTDSEMNALLAEYTDATYASNYAKSSIASGLKTGVVSGTTSNTIAPKSNITRAEVAVIIQRVLKKSSLI